MRYMQADDFHGTDPMVTPGGFHFGGGSRVDIALGIVKFLEGIIEGRILMQKITLSNDIEIDDFNVDTITFKYVETSQPIGSEHFVDDVDAVDLSRALADWRLKTKRGDEPGSFADLVSIFKAYRGNKEVKFK